MRHAMYWIVPSKEQLPLVVRKRNSLTVNFKVNHRRRWRRRSLEQLTHGLLNCVRPGERLHFDRYQIEHVASRSSCQSLLRRTADVVGFQVAFRQYQSARQRHLRYRVLVHQGREGAEDGLDGVALQSDPFGRGFDEEVTHVVVRGFRLGV